MIAQTTHGFGGRRNCSSGRNYVGAALELGGDWLGRSLALQGEREGTEADFFGGCSIPRNKEIMRVFRDLEIVEHLGSGVPRILKACDRDAFEIRDSYVRIIFRFEQVTEESPAEKRGEKEGEKRGGSMGGVIDGSIGGSISLTDRQKEILSLIQMNPKISLRQIARELNIGQTAIDKHINSLKEKGVLKRVGGTRGHWEVVGEKNL